MNRIVKNRKDGDLCGGGGSYPVGDWSLTNPEDVTRSAPSSAVKGPHRSVTKLKVIGMRTVAAMSPTVYAYRVLIRPIDPAIMDTYMTYFFRRIPQLTEDKRRRHSHPDGRLRFVPHVECGLVTLQSALPPPIHPKMELENVEVKHGTRGQRVRPPSRKRNHNSSPGAFSRWPYSRTPYTTSTEIAPNTCMFGRGHVIMRVTE